ncbi:WD repeat protein [Ichthyophthirius multifiliis]|uniref:WD repeat protein n=1 Tax=Ichthyophthirius multifiliis TaxID=5932 RepID=G0R3B0_ICHMU|nr:WD repeat protein [Ichthyophthirius multifiliis]EGR28053.1 WD repeat protein [Ichthyophthirius multifiliis]|eukprot:XP_004027398.1 WD repeat protein [Ichthyophthirius multifiliis]
MQFYKFFHENPLSVDIQALGFQCAIGFKEGLKFFFILEDELKLAYSEYNIKGCYSTKYSEGGNLLAASNYNIICIYNHNTFEQLIQLNGHSGYIKKLKWTQEDTQIQSNCSQGIFNCWNVNNQQRIMEHAYKQIKYTACVYDKFLDWAACCSQDCKVKIFDDKGQNLIQEYDFSPYYVTSALLINDYQCIVFGMNTGSLRIYLWPLDIQTKHLEYFEIPLHQTNVISLQSTPDLGFLVSAGDDGSFYVTKIREFQNGKEIEVLQAFEDTKFSVGSVYCLNSLCLTSNIIEENKKDIIKELEFRIQNLKTDQEDEKERQISVINSLLKKQENKNNEIVAQQKEQLSKIMEDCDNKIKELQHNISKIRNEYKVEFKNLEENNMATLLKCYQQKDLLQQEYNDFIEYAQNIVQQEKKQYQLIQNQQEKDYENQFQQLFGRFNSSENKLDENLLKYKEVFNQQKEVYLLILYINYIYIYINKEHLLFVEQIKIQLQKEKKEEIKRQEELRTSNSKKQNDIDRFNQRRLELESIQKEASNQIDHLEEEKKKFIEKNLIMQKLLQDKEDKINQKEIEIKQYRNKNHHLQNFKTVYDYQVQSLKEERLPLVVNTKNMENNVRGLYKELSDESETAKKFNQKLEEALIQRIALKQQFKQKNDILQITQNKIQNFEYDILQLIQNVKYENWFRKMNQIYNKYFVQNSKLNNLIKKNDLSNNSQEKFDEKLLKALNMGNNDQIQDELIRQRDFMSKKIQTISNLNKQTENDRDDVVIRVQNENTHLIKECNKLREERKQNFEQLGCLQKALDIVTKELMRISLGIEENVDQEFIDQQLFDFDTSKIILKLEQEKSIIQQKQQTQQDQQQQQQQNYQQQQQYQKQTSNNNQQKKFSRTPFQIYEDEKQYKKQKYNNSQSYYYSQSPVKSNISFNNNLLTSLIKEMEKFSNDKNINLNQRLKEKVQNYLYNEDPSLTIPNISTIDKTYAGHSIEDTKLGPYHSINNETLNLTKSQPDILSLLKVKNNDSIVSIKNKLVQKNKSTGLFPKLKKI